MQGDARSMCSRQCIPIGFGKTILTELKLASSAQAAGRVSACENFRSFSHCLGAFLKT